MAKAPLAQALQSKLVPAEQPLQLGSHSREETLTHAHGSALVVLGLTHADALLGGVLHKELPRSAVITVPVMRAIATITPVVARLAGASVVVLVIGATTRSH